MTRTESHHSLRFSAEVCHGFGHAEGLVPRKYDHEEARFDWIVSMFEGRFHVPLYGQCTDWSPERNMLDHWYLISSTAILISICPLHEPTCIMESLMHAFMNRALKSMENKRNRGKAPTHMTWSQQAVVRGCLCVPQACRKRRMWLCWGGFQVILQGLGLAYQECGSVESTRWQGMCSRLKIMMYTSC